MAHPPFKQVEASRPDFVEERFESTKTPAPEWVPGAGLNRLPWPVDTPFKEIDPKEEPSQIYKLMIGGIIVVSFSHPGPDKQKDSCRNIKETKEFVVNIISEAFVEAANYTSIDAPPEVSEWDLSGLTKEPSKMVKPPRVKESAFSMECDDEGRLTGTSVFGRVKLFHVREDILQTGGVIDQARMQSVSRLGGISYGRTTKGLELPRPVWSQESQRKEVQEALTRAQENSSKADTP